MIIACVYKLAKRLFDNKMYLLVSVSGTSSVCEEVIVLFIRRTNVTFTVRKFFNDYEHPIWSERIIFDLFPNYYIQH